MNGHVGSIPITRSNFQKPHKIGQFLTVLPISLLLQRPATTNATNFRLFQTRSKLSMSPLPTLAIAPTSQHPLQGRNLRCVQAAVILVVGVGLLEIVPIPRSWNRQNFFGRLGTFGSELA
jgi:hypothetical protein